MKESPHYRGRQRAVGETRQPESATPLPRRRLHDTARIDRPEDRMPRTTPREPRPTALGRVHGASTGRASTCGAGNGALKVRRLPQSRRLWSTAYTGAAGAGARPAHRRTAALCGEKRGDRAAMGRVATLRGLESADNPGITRRRPREELRSSCRGRVHAVVRYVVGKPRSGFPADPVKYKRDYALAGR